MTMPPTAARGMIYLNLRKHTSRSFELAQFVEQGHFGYTRHVHSATVGDEDRARLLDQLEPDQVDLWNLARAGDWPTFLDKAVRSHRNIIVSGATGS